MNARQLAAIDKELAACGMRRTNGSGYYVTVAIDGPDGVEHHKVWATDDGSTPRQNPPLAQHMAEDSLEAIAQGLDQRIYENPLKGVEFLLLCAESVAQGLAHLPRSEEQQQASMDLHRARSLLHRAALFVSSSK